MRDQGSHRDGLSCWPRVAWASVVAVVALEIVFGASFGRQLPVPFLSLFASVVLAGAAGGRCAGLLGGAIASAVMIYASTVPFGPASLIGDPLRVALGCALALVTGGMLGATRDENRRLISELRAERGRLADRVTEQSSTIASTADALASSEAQLRELQKLDAIGRLAGGIAHDFNNVLTALIGNADLALADVGDDHPAAESLKEILADAERGAELTTHLLTFARRRALDRRPIDARGVIERTEPMLRRLVGDEIELRIELPDEPCVVVADAGELGQVLVNLVVNGRDAIQAGGGIVCSLLLTQGDDGAQQVTMRVVDSGSGVPEELRDSIFEPFFTTRPDGAGTGLGLSTSYGIARQLGGTLALVDTSPRGTTFDVVLPRSAQSPLAADVAPVVAAVPVGGERVLLVEDDPNVSAAVGAGLRRLGFSVAQAENGRSALALLGAGQSFDVVVSDVKMPDMGGLEFASRARERWPELPLLLVSGHGDADPDSPPGLLVLRKPYTPNELAGRIREALTG